MPPAIGAPSEGDFQAGGEARKKMNLVWAWVKARPNFVFGFGFGLRLELGALGPGL